MSRSHTAYTAPCSTVLLFGGSCGSCLALRAEEDVTEEERDTPPCRWPLTPNDMKVKQIEKKKAQRTEKQEGRLKMRHKKSRK